MTVPYIFANATSSLPLSELDANFATPITLGNTAVYLGNTTTALVGVNLSNSTISNSNVSSSNVTITGGTINGVAISNATYAGLGTMATQNANNVTITGGSVNANIAGNGASLSNLNASNITSGTLDVARGGTGSANLTAGSVVIGNNTSQVVLVAPGTSGNVLTSNGTAWISNAASGGTGGGGGLTWQAVVTSNTTVSASNAYAVSTVSQPVVITLPASPGAGNTVQLTDYARTWAVNAVTLNRNGSNIAGAASNVALNTNGASVALVYIDAAQGWIAFNGFSTPPVGAFTGNENT
jgi:hypothetical protein